MALVEFRGVTKAYSRRTALSDLSLDFEGGRITGLLGPNGSGKTTLIKLANGLLRPDKGTITIAGSCPGPETKAVTAYLPDRTVMPERLRAEDVMDRYDDFFADFDRSRAEAMLNDLGIDGGMKLKAMSKGTKEKMQLCMVMSRSARVYFLDEPIGGVDPATRDYILRTIISNYSEDAAVVISTHLITEVESVLDDVVFLREGRVVLQGNADDIREENGESIDQLFRKEFRC